MDSTCGWIAKAIGLVLTGFAISQSSQIWFGITRNYFKQSFTLFRERCNPEGIYLSWCGAVESPNQALLVTLTSRLGRCFATRRPTLAKVSS